jgi:hypothetical protein
MGKEQTTKLRLLSTESEITISEISRSQTRQLRQSFGGGGTVQPFRQVQCHLNLCDSVCRSFTYADPGNGRSPPNDNALFDCITFV